MRNLLAIAIVALFGLVGFQVHAENADKNNDSVIEELSHEVDEITDEMGIEDGDESVGDELEHELDELDDEAKERAEEAEKEMKKGH